MEDEGIAAIILSASSLAEDNMEGKGVLIKGRKPSLKISDLKMVWGTLGMKWPELGARRPPRTSRGEWSWKRMGQLTTDTEDQVEGKPT
jgi:hypothetical protein